MDLHFYYSLDILFRFTPLKGIALYPYATVNTKWISHGFFPDLNNHYYIDMSTLLLSYDEKIFVKNDSWENYVLAYQ